MAVEMNRLSAATPSQASAGMLDRCCLAFACFSFLYLYTNLGLALPKVWGFPLWPSFFYVLILAFTGTILVISAAAIEVLRQHRIFVFTLLALSFLEAARIIFSPLTQEGTQLFISNSEYVLVTISFLVIFSLCTRLDRVIRVVGLVVAMSAGINLIQYYLPQLLPVTFHTHVPGRAAGFAEDPNESAAYICLALPLVAFFARGPMRYMWYVIALAGVAVTFSRGGIVLWATAVAVTEALKQRERGPLLFAGLVSLTIKFLSIALVLACAASVWGDISALFPYLDDNTRSRLNLAADDRDRLYLAERGIDLFLNAPLFGNGLGGSDTVGGPPDGPHNMFIMMLADLGLVGGIWITAFLLSIARYGAPFGLPVVIMFCISALFTHNHFEWPAVGMLFALYLVVTRSAAQQHMGQVGPLLGVHVDHNIGWRF